MVLLKSPLRPKVVSFISRRSRYGGRMSQKTPDIGDVWRYFDIDGLEHYFLIGEFDMIKSAQFVRLITLSLDKRANKWQLVPITLLERSPNWSYIA